MTLDQFSAQPSIGLRTDCYAAVLPKFCKQYAHAHFEIVMRIPASVGLTAPPSDLSPSPSLLRRYKEQKCTFAEFAAELKKELFSNPRTLLHMQKLLDLSRHQLVFLVCCEKDATQCHRSLLKQWMEHDL